jgi:hypothetical protein
LKQVRQHIAVQNRLLEQRNLIKETSGSHSDQAGEQTELEFVNLLRQLIPDELKIVQRGRLLMDDPKDSPQLDIMILKPGGEKVLNGQNYYPRENLLAAFECKLTLRKGDLAKAAAAANAIKGNIATGRANERYEESETYPTCKPYYGLLALSWDGGDGPEHATDLASLLLDSFKRCQLGRQVDCVLVPSLSFFTVTHEPDPFEQGCVNLSVYFEPTLSLYDWPDGVRRFVRPHGHPEFADRPAAEFRKFDHHNSLMGLGNFLAHVLGEHRQEFAFLTQNYAYYGHARMGTQTAYQGPPVDID